MANPVQMMLENEVRDVQIFRTQALDVLAFVGVDLDMIKSWSGSRLQQKLIEIERLMDESEEWRVAPAGPSLQLVIDACFDALDSGGSITVIPDDPDTMRPGAPAGYGPPLQGKAPAPKKKRESLEDMAGEISDLLGHEVFMEILHKYEDKLKERQKVDPVRKTMSSMSGMDADAQKMLLELPVPSPAAIKRVGKVRKTRSYFAGQAIAQMGADAPLEDLIHFVNVAYGSVNIDVTKNNIRGAIAALLGFASRSKVLPKDQT